MVSAVQRRLILPTTRHFSDKLYGRSIPLHARNAIIADYAKTGHLDDARSLFDSMPDRDVVSWNAIIAAYAKNGHLHQARLFFDQMPQRDVVSWNTIIAAYAKNRQPQTALQMAHEMALDGKNPDKVTFISMLDACALLGDAEQGRTIHAVIARTEFTSIDDIIVVSNAMISMYSKCGCIDEARMVFDYMPDRNIVSWTAMISAYSHNGFGKQREKALELSQKMMLSGLKLDNISFISILDACACLVQLKQGRLIHACIAQIGCESDFIVTTALLNMYGKCGRLDDARCVFNRMSQQNVISWSAIIAAYAQNEQGEVAIELFWQMVYKGVRPDKITFISILDACAALGDLKMGNFVHASIVQGGWESDVVVATAIINMYGKCRSLADAKNMFAKTQHRDVVSWSAMIAAYAYNGHLEDAKKRFDEMPYQTNASCTAMITAYAQNKQGKGALELFQRMLIEGVRPNQITFISLLDACSGLAALEMGKMIHASIVQSGFNLLCEVLSNALISMYGKCGGSLEDAKKVFCKMPLPSVTSWNTVIMVYSQNGQGQGALELFKQMELEGVKPDKITFISVLTACSHAGLLDDALYYFAHMYKAHSLVPSLEHYACMIDVYGRAGQLDEAVNLIGLMPFELHTCAWMGLLGACKIHHDLEHGACAAQHLSALDSKAYASILAAA